MSRRPRRFKAPGRMGILSWMLCGEFGQQTEKSLRAFSDGVGRGSQAVLSELWEWVISSCVAVSHIADLATSILAGSEFDARKREIAVLRVAHVTRAEYEWVQHVTVAKMTGVTDQV